VTKPGCVTQEGADGPSHRRHAAGFTSRSVIETGSDLSGAVADRIAL